VFINNISRFFPHLLIRLLERNMVSSSPLSFPGLHNSNEVCYFPPHCLESSFVTTVVHCFYLSSESFKGVFTYPSRNNISLGAFLFPMFLI